MRDPTYDNITHAWRNLAALASGIIPHKIAAPSLEPTMEDARELQNDLLLLARKVDALIEAYGEYCQSNGILSQRDVKDCFKDVLFGALDGNALFLIEDGTRERIEALAEEAA